MKIIIKWWLNLVFICDFISSAPRKLLALRQQKFVSRAKKEGNKKYLLRWKKIILNVIVYALFDYITNSLEVLYLLDIA